jgi:hypothetical protein
LLPGKRVARLGEWMEALGRQPVSVASIASAMRWCREAVAASVPDANRFGSALVRSWAVVALNGRAASLVETVLGGARTIALVSAGEIEPERSSPQAGPRSLRACGALRRVQRGYADGGCSDGATSGSIRWLAGDYQIRGAAGADRVPGGRLR